MDKTIKDDLFNLDNHNQVFEDFEQDPADAAEIPLEAYQNVDKDLKKLRNDSRDLLKKHPRLDELSKDLVKRDDSDNEFEAVNRINDDVNQVIWNYQKILKQER